MRQSYDETVSQSDGPSLQILAGDEPTLPAQTQIGASDAADRT
jgi:hypothetical protein